MPVVRMEDQLVEAWAQIEAEAKRANKYADEVERLRAVLENISRCDLALDAKYAQETVAKLAKDALGDD